MDAVASQNSSDGTGIFLAHLAVLAVLVVVLSLSYTVYTDDLWMKAEHSKEAKKITRLEKRVTELEAQLEERK